MNKILVTGATGNFGKVVVETLVKKGVDKNSITALVRDKAKAEHLNALGVNIAIGNYNDYDSLLKAFKSVDKLLFVSSSEIQNRSEQQVSVVKAAKEAGVKHILYTSVERKTDSETSPLKFVLSSHMATENAIKESGMAYTFLRNGLYLDMLPWFLGQKVLETGIYLPAGEGKIAFALRNEMAEVAANVLTSDGHENKVYDVSGTEPVSFGEIAQILSEKTGKEVSYNSPDMPAYIKAMVDAGTPEQYAYMFGGFAEAARQGELESGHSNMEQLLGRKSTSVEVFLTKMYL